MAPSVSHKLPHEVAHKRISKKSQAARQKLLSAALQVIGSKGYHDATMEEIARTAGVSKGLAYYHFTSKAKLASVVLDSGLQGLLEKLTQAKANAANALDAFDAMVDQLADSLYANEMVTRFVFAEMLQEDRDCSELMMGYVDKFVSLISELIAQGQSEGSFRAEINVEFTSVSLFGAVMTSAMYFIGEAGDVSLSREKFMAEFKTIGSHICLA